MKNQNRIPMISRLLALLLALAFGAQSLDAACYHVECRRGLNSATCSCSLYFCSDEAGRTSDYITCVEGWGQYQSCQNHRVRNGTKMTCTTVISYAAIANCLGSAGSMTLDCAACITKRTTGVCLRCFSSMGSMPGACRPCGNLVTCVTGAPESSWVTALAIVEAGGECPKTPTPCDPI